MTKFAIIGYGKMGKEVEKILLKENYDISVIIDNENDWKNNFTDFLKSDVAIEFTTPKTALDNFHHCFHHHIPLVSGTTGWGQHLQQICDDCIKNSHSFIYGSNYSIGANLFFKINDYMAALMNSQPQYDLLIKERHHTAKLDRPSGTAITLAEIILNQIERKNSWQLDGQNPDTISVLAERIDNIPGTHEVHYFSGADTIKIEHIAHNRSGFASGAVKAALWLLHNPGVYDFKNIFHLFSTY